MRSVLLIALSVAGCAIETQSNDTGVAHEAIVGGAEVGVCAWPSAVFLDRGEHSPCSGVLVAPNLVLFAAHCMADGPPPSSAKFGVSAASPAFEVATRDCRADPSFVAFPEVGRGHDVAYCKLEQAVSNVPIVPISMACEDDAVVAGSEMVAVGFGKTETNQSGAKRSVTLPLHGIVQNEAYIGGDGKGTCYGDSGGPIFARLPSGEWRVFGIISWAPGDCGTGEYASIIYAATTWIEKSSGIDLTPCGNSGKWAPTTACARFPLEPDSSAATWATGCSGGPVSEASSSCGPANDGTDPPPEKPVSAPGGCNFETAATGRGDWAIALFAMAYGAHRRRGRRK